MTANGSDLLRFAYLVLGDRHRAEEAVQEALVRACGRWRRVSAADDPRAYVRRMVVNADISWWRKSGGVNTQSTRCSPGPGGPRTSRTADPATTVAEVDAMWRLCANLPRGQRAAVVLRYYEGLLRRRDRPHPRLRREHRPVPDPPRARHPARPSLRAGAPS